MIGHARFHEDIGAYLLGALDEGERRSFERHARACDECREELERLRPAAEALPGSVEQLAPPPGLKARLMAEVEPEPERARSRRPARSRRWLRPALAAAAVGVLIAIGVTQLSGDETRTVTATVDEAMPRAGGNLEIEDASATLHLHDMPDLGGTSVYQVWFQHDDRMVPARTFEIGASGTGAVALQDVGDADGVYVTREPRGGAQVPSEEPIVSVPL
jgi:anti-sigma factor RsiW